MPWTAILAVMALLGLQLAIAAASLYAYNRIRSKEDTQGQEKISWGIRIEAANTKADSAHQIASAMEVSHFKALRVMFEAQSVELSEAKARITSLEKELKVCQMKLASEERINRRDESRRADKEKPDVPAMAGKPVDVDSLVEQGIAIPLGSQHPAPVVKRRRPFGQPL